MKVYLIWTKPIIVLHPKKNFIRFYAHNCLATQSNPIISTSSFGLFRLTLSISIFSISNFRFIELKTNWTADTNYRKRNGWTQKMVKWERGRQIQNPSICCIVVPMGWESNINRINAPNNTSCMLHQQNKCQYLLVVRLFRINKCLLLLFIIGKICSKYCLFL